ncbi:MAG: hypothetical protein SNJ69_18235 [Chloroflexaceae bacterium]
MSVKATSILRRAAATSTRASELTPGDGIAWVQVELPARLAEPQRQSPEADTLFWARVERSPAPDGCWRWSGATDLGYGVLKRQQLEAVLGAGDPIDLIEQSAEKCQVAAGLCGRRRAIDA